MKQDNRRNLFKINIFSLILFISYAFTFCFMHRLPWRSFSFESFYFSAPLICIVLCWSQKSAYLIYLNDIEINKNQAFQRDFFILNFSLLLSFFLEMIINFKYSDTRTLWSIFIYPFFLYGFVFSFFYAFVLRIKSIHKFYMFASACLFLGFFPALECLVSIPLFKNMGQLVSALYLSAGFILFNFLILYILRLFQGKKMS